MALSGASNALCNLRSDNVLLISDAMVSNSSSNTCSNCKWRQSVSRATNSWLLSCKSLRRKGNKVKEADWATLQSGMTEAGLTEGGGTPVSKELQGLSRFHFHSPFSNVLTPLWKDGQYGVDILQWESLIGSRRHMNQKATSVRYILNFPISKSIVLSFSCYKEDQGNNIQSSNNTERKREGLVWKIKSTRASVYQRPSQGHFLLGGLRAPFLLMEGKQNRWDTNCTFIHLKVQGNFPSAPVKFSDCLSIL